MHTLATLPASDVTVGMTIAFSLNGTFRARKVRSIEHPTDTLVVFWVGAYGLTSHRDAPVSVEIH